jgi:hypothetical protein
MLRAVFLGVAASCCVLMAGSARAQFTIEPFIDKQPLNFSVQADVQLSKFGPNVVASAKASAQVQEIKPIIDAMLPEANRNLACKPNSKIGVKITDIRPRSSYGFGARKDPFSIEVKADVEQCGRFKLFGGTIAVSVPVLVSVRNQAIELASGPIEVDPQGVYLARIPVPDSFVIGRATKSIKPVTDDLIRKINAWLNKQLINPALRHHIAAYNLRLHSPRVDLRGNSLVVDVELTGQVPVRTVNRWLAGR